MNPSPVYQPNSNRHVRVTGILKYFSNLYNTDIWLFAIWAVVLTAALGCILGLLTDFIMERSGLDLKNPKIIEH
jgi:hypothetical protein